ncbi:hypothetical protein EVAR_46008_1 [Eumeta japonica]|uniref:Uncharacterized protein n=1 Tax=Eumeta variegata TaxID=151549 RepID=A0A4C1X9C4_EUMVA|nr:hypothetical protein EVAR_46008_1 [Eumeta japonica]
MRELQLARTLDAMQRAHGRSLPAAAGRDRARAPNEATRKKFSELFYTSMPPRSSLRLPERYVISVTAALNKNNGSIRLPAVVEEAPWRRRRVSRKCAIEKTSIKAGINVPLCFIAREP